MDQTKIGFAVKGRQLAAQLAQLSDDMVDFADVYDHRLYGPEADHAITADDLATTTPYPGMTLPGSVTPDDIYAFVILCRQIESLLTGQAVTSADYQSTVDKLRNDL